MTQNQREKITLAYQYIILDFNTCIIYYNKFIISQATYKKNAHFKVSLVNFTQFDQ